MQKSGMVSWDDLDFNKKEKFKTEDKPKRFITLAKGKQENNLRIIAGP